jgi:8-oxo-dGTP pyrophosphatase MutT (NUDIX family)
MQAYIIQKLKEALSRHPKVHLSNHQRRPSAVLIPICFQTEKYTILFTRRTELVHHHKGEISFPGGGYHSEDGTLLHTALRESFEEIGLKASDVEVMGELDDTLTRGSPYIISPFVGSILPDNQFKLSSFEIAEIIEIPILELLKEGCRREIPGYIIDDVSITSYIYTYDGKLITGATARILKQFLDIYTRVSGFKV